MANGFDNRGIAFQALNLADAAETCAFVSSGRGEEANPLFGSHPSCTKVFQIATIAVQGGVVAANLRLVF